MQASRKHNSNPNPNDNRMAVSNVMNAQSNFSQSLSCSLTKLEPTSLSTQIARFAMSISTRRCFCSSIPETNTLELLKSSHRLGHQVHLAWQIDSTAVFVVQIFDQKLLAWNTPKQKATIKNPNLYDQYRKSSRIHLRPLSSNRPQLPLKSLTISKSQTDAMNVKLSSTIPLRSTTTTKQYITSNAISAKHTSRTLKVCTNTNGKHIPSRAHVDSSSQMH